MTKEGFRRYCQHASLHYYPELLGKSKGFLGLRSVGYCDLYLWRDSITGALSLGETFSEDFPPHPDKHGLEALYEFERLTDVNTSKDLGLDFLLLQ